MEGGGKNKRNANRQKITGYMSALLQIAEAVRNEWTVQSAQDFAEVKH